MDDKLYAVLACHGDYYHIGIHLTEEGAEAEAVEVVEGFGFALIGETTHAKFAYLKSVLEVEEGVIADIHLLDVKE